ncbi:MAG: ATP-binding protein [Planctomycetia bacterium]|nr:ATP-binding protein [Planctomycetia bacterium]
MVDFQRRLSIALPERQSAFLWGARKTGKSTFLRAAFPGSLSFDFLRTDLLLAFTTRPALLREQLSAASPSVLALPVILDEVQKVPALLDEVHGLIEERGLRFVLCGSSARKLKRGRANLLGGRAWRYEMFPLVSAEFPRGSGEPAGMDLLKALEHGLVPSHYLSADPRKSLDAYVRDYLKEEVFDEGLTRNVPAFSRFFEALGYCHGELINHANIARDCGVDAKTVKEYFQILCDTLLGRLVLPYKKRQERQVISKAPKFYLFDVGVAGALGKRRILEPRGDLFGRAFAHLVFMELVAHASYSELGYDIHFWRTKGGAEVDFVLGNGEVAIEVKGTSRVDDRDLRSLRAFGETHRPRSSIVVCNESAERIVDGIRIIPWKRFFSGLWEGRIIA